ncbi:4Fe-4S binding protein [Sedimentibacter sp. zth1]|uniref:[Fe-Fe] hydrogenase large subunit C-terminal domain-containing protein n=1 Tax=Sedimentibacter sp. zth1 TaxID=2816908 RepID=UPI001A91426F|nr:[Fe-Fe] hydrogenase large subunit C-terminal domain-containing protein [Sedimentibacter sp. zth1]QSX05821.1 4Fe-4S binding protein [Sedimentibacter sp. zth1]
MKILDFVPANCKNCYKCVRNCTVKAIKMVNDQAQIVENRCIACGKCFLVCPQNARYILSDLDKVINAINENKKVIISIAPSYLGIYKDPYKLIGALRKMGIHRIEETSIGANIVTELYNDYVEKSSGENIITTACPSVNLMIQTYYPELINNMIPVDSPMIAHCKMLRKEFGKDIYITFLGPCIAKKCEAYPYQVTNIMDAVISFEELENYFSETGIDISKCENSTPDKTGNKLGQKYPTENGILPGLKDVLDKKNYTSISVSGTQQCKDLFEELKNNDLKNIFIEANSCEGGCIEGPAVPKDSTNVFIRKINLKSMLKRSDYFSKQVAKDVYNINFSRKFRDKHLVTKKYTDEEIKSVLEKLGKHNVSDELNCSSCGYETCRQKAISVLDGMSYPEMCMPYMKAKAERISNISFEYSPNILFIVDKDLNILELNPQAEKAFCTKISNMRGKNLSMLIPTVECEQVIETEQNILNKKLLISSYGITAYGSFIYLPNVKMIFIILLDVTDEENKKDKLLKLKLNTIETADKVIEKQMRVVQEIAGLLGETTAETKTTLLKLKKVVTEEESDI